MKTTVTDRLATWRSGAAFGGGRPGTSRRDDLITALFSGWLLVGLFIDGWAHNNLESVETFLTPWHAALYSGYAATATWMGWLVLRGMRGGLRASTAIPIGYGLGLLGAAVFGAAGVVDFIWHTCSASRRASTRSSAHLTWPCSWPASSWRRPHCEPPGRPPIRERCRGAGSCHRFCR